MKPDGPISAAPPRAVLRGVPRVGFYDGGARCPEDVPFPASLRAALEYLGKDLGCFEVRTKAKDCRFGCTYAFLMGVSGAAFCLSWGDGWQADNVEIMYMSADPAAPFRRACEAVGLAYDAIGKDEPNAGELLFRRRIVESVNRGIPVIAFGVIGPPEACVVAGYDEEGDVLIGWNFFQDIPEFNAGVEREPSGYFRKRDWFAATPALLFLGRDAEKPSLEVAVRDALAWALEVVRVPQPWPHRATGLAAYDAWAAHLLRDQDFAADPAAVYERFSVHDDAVGTIAEGRWYAAQFLTLAARIMPNVAEHLLKAAACYVAEHDLMWKAWGLVGGNGRSPERAAKLADPTVRRQMVPVIREARDRDEEAAGHIEQACRTR